MPTPGTQALAEQIRQAMVDAGLTPDRTIEGRAEIAFYFWLPGPLLPGGSHRGFVAFSVDEDEDGPGAVLALEDRSAPAPVVLDVDPADLKASMDAALAWLELVR